MILLPTLSTLTDTLFPYTTLLRSIVPHSNASCVVYRIHNGRSHPANAKLAHSLSFHWGRNRIGFFQKDHILVRDIRMDRHLIARKVMVDEIPKALVDDRFFHKRGAHPHGHRADDLASRGFWSENPADAPYSNHSPIADFSRCGGYCHLDKLN